MAYWNPVRDAGLAETWLPSSGQALPLGTALWLPRVPRQAAREMRHIQAEPLPPGVPYYVT